MAKNNRKTIWRDGCPLTSRDRAALKEIKRKQRKAAKAEIRAQVEDMTYFHPYKVEKDLPRFGLPVEKLVVPSKDEFDFNLLAEEYNSKLEELRALYKAMNSAAQENSLDTYLWD